MANLPFGWPNLHLCNYLPDLPNSDGNLTFDINRCAAEVDRKRVASTWMSAHSIDVFLSPYPIHPRTTAWPLSGEPGSNVLFTSRKICGAGLSASLIKNHIQPTCRNVKKRGNLTNMQSILSKAIEPGTVKAIAPDLHISDRNLYRWMEGDGCPVNRLTQLVRILYVHNPNGAALVMSHVNAEYEALLAKHGKRPTGRQIETSLHKETSEAVMALLAGRPVAEVRKEVLEARAAADATLRYLDQLEAEEAERRKQPRLKAVNN